MSTHYSLSDFEAADPDASKTGIEWRFMCPAPGCSDGKPKDAAHRSLSYNSSNGLYNCKRCGIRGKEIGHWEAGKAPKKSPSTLQDAFAVPMPQKIHRDAEKGNSGENKGLSDDARKQLVGLRPVGSTPGEKYLESRGLPLGLLMLSSVQFAPNVYGRESVLFPIKDETGELVGYDVRSIQGAFKGALGTKRFGVFASNWAREAKTVTLTEAPIDALSLATCKVPAFALCGKDNFPDWMLSFCAFKTVQIAFDADPEGDAAADRLTGVLRSRGASVIRLRPPTEKDWNAFLCAQGKEAMADFLKPFSMFP
jgi:hypothetical protein